MAPYVPTVFACQFTTSGFAMSTVTMSFGSATHPATVHVPPDTGCHVDLSVGDGSTPLTHWYITQLACPLAGLVYQARSWLDSSIPHPFVGGLSPRGRQWSSSPREFGNGLGHGALVEQSR